MTVSEIPAESPRIRVRQFEKEEPMNQSNYSQNSQEMSNNLQSTRISNDTQTHERREPSKNGMHDFVAKNSPLTGIHQKYLNNFILF